MAKWTLARHADIPPVGSYPVRREVDGLVDLRLMSPDDFSLWLCIAEFTVGGTIQWNGGHSDDALYILEGSVEIDGVVVETGGAVVVEADASTRLRALAPTVIAHYGSRVPGPATGGPLGDPSPPWEQVHAIGGDGSFLSGSREGVSATWYADGTCEHCRAQLLKVTVPEDPSPVAKPHDHSQDEIILVVDGGFSMGSFHFEPLDAISIPAHVRYALLPDPGGHSFLNFRRDVSWQVYERGSEPLLETALARGGRAVSR